MCVKLGSVIKGSQLNKELLSKMSIPIVISSISQRIKEIVADSGYQELSLNSLLAEELTKTSVDIRPQLVSDEVIKILSSVKAPIYLTDYEMLFDPRYDIDVLKLFYEISRRKKIVVKWSGTWNNEYLEYSTSEYMDYHSYIINDYDITCII